MTTNGVTARKQQSSAAAKSTRSGSKQQQQQPRPKPQAGRQAGCKHNPGQHRNGQEEKKSTGQETTETAT
jgi:hypothetical protein